MTTDAPKNTSRTRKAMIVTIIAFFLAFPAIGMVYVWMDAHRRINTAAQPAAEIILNAVLPTWSYEAFEYHASPALRMNLEPGVFEAAGRDLGAFQSMEPIRITRTRSTTVDRVPMHLAYVQTKVQFSQAEVPIEIILQRRVLDVIQEIETRSSETEIRTGSEPEMWLIHEFHVGDVSLTPRRTTED